LVHDLVILVRGTAFRRKSVPKTRRIIRSSEVQVRAARHDKAAGSDLGLTPDAQWSAVDVRFHLAPQIRRPVDTLRRQHASIAPGSVTLALLSAVQGVLEDASQRYQADAAGAVNVAPVIADIQLVNQMVTSEETLIRPLVDGQVKRITLGRIDGRRVDLTRKDLAISDRVVLDAVQAESAVVGVPTSRIAEQAVGSLGRTRAARAVPNQSGSDIPFVQSVVNYLTVSVPAQIIQGGTLARTVFTAALGGPTTPPGAIVYAGITQLTYVIANAVESGAKSIITSNTDLQVSQQSQAAQFLIDSYSGQAGGEVLDEIQKLRNAVSALRQILDRLTSSSSDLENQLNPSNPSSVDSKIDQYEANQHRPPPPSVLGTYNGIYNDVAVSYDSQGDENTVYPRGQLTITITSDSNPGGYGQIGGYMTLGNYEGIDYSGDLSGYINTTYNSTDNTEIDMTSGNVTVRLLGIYNAGTIALDDIDVNIPDQNGSGYDGGSIGGNQPFKVAK
jgi:hypothetical protein